LQLLPRDLSGPSSRTDDPGLTSFFPFSSVTSSGWSFQISLLRAFFLIFQPPRQYRPTLFFFWPSNDVPISEFFTFLLNCSFDNGTFGLTDLNPNFPKHALFVTSRWISPFLIVFPNVPSPELKGILSDASFPSNAPWNFFSLSRTDSRFFADFFCKHRICSPLSLESLLLPVVKIYLRLPHSSS